MSHTMKSLDHLFENNQRWASGIKEQLADLEERKEAAEKELAQYNEKLALLDKEAEKIIENYKNFFGF